MTTFSATTPPKENRSITNTAPTQRKDNDIVDMYKTGKNNPMEPHQILRRSQRLPFAKQTEKLVGVPYYTVNNKKKMSNHRFVHESQHSQPETNNDEESTNRNVRAILKERHKNCEIRNYYLKQLNTTNFIRSGGM